MRFDAIVFDFDGVLVESADVKTQAFGLLYAKYGKKIAQQVVDYHLAHAGISRYVKFKVWQEDFLGLPYTQEVGEQLSREFSRLVVDSIVAAPYVRGAEEFLKTYYRDLPLYVASGTPEDELQDIVKRRNMQYFFKGVYGTPSSKGEILCELIRGKQYQPGRVLMVGDALADWHGAREAGACFVGRSNNGFPIDFPVGTVLIEDLTKLPELIESL